MTHSAIILGGGTGTRFKGSVPKQFLPVEGRPLIAYTIDAFEQAPSIDAIVVVVPAGSGWEEQRTADLITSYGLAKLSKIITGGETRQLSCWQALRYLKAMSPEIVVVHDAARPLVTTEMVETAVHEGTLAMTFGLPAKDTIVSLRDGAIAAVLRREDLCQVQTPQAFAFETLWEAHEKARAAGISDAGDDAGLVLRLGKRVKVLPGDPCNIKITDPRDLELVRQLLLDRRRDK
jgi:2-C-methyl-D-erythritol 4-phosphate cytidylyltransferase